MFNGRTTVVLNGMEWDGPADLSKGWVQREASWLVGSVAQMYSSVVLSAQACSWIEWVVTMYWLAGLAMPADWLVEEYWCSEV